MWVQFSIRRLSFRVGEGGRISSSVVDGILPLCATGDPHAPARHDAHRMSTQTPVVDAWICGGRYQLQCSNTCFCPPPSLTLPTTTTTTAVQTNHVQIWTHVEGHVGGPVPRTREAASYCGLSTHKSLPANTDCVETCSFSAHPKGVIQKWCEHVFHWHMSCQQEFRLWA